MDEKLEKQLYEAYPKLFAQVGGSPQETCMYWGCAHGDGWFNLLKEACEKLKDAPIQFAQIKEKFGGLRIYYDYLGSDDENAMSDDEVSDILEDIEDRSLTICEVCGAPGKPTGPGWIQTLCEEHRQK